MRQKKWLAAVLSAAMAVTTFGVPVKAADSLVTDAQLSDAEVEAPAVWGVTPNEEQLHYMKNGLAAFCHFGPNTFNNVEWGESYGERLPSDIFRLSENFDAEKMVKAVKDAGFSHIILTAKHHDGFCLWSSELTTYDIGSTDYKGGKGDILEEISDACTKYNLDMGCYLSPWDIHEDKYGCFGDNNNRENSGGYTDYNELYIDSIKEICTAKKADGSFKYGNNHPDRRSDRFIEWWMDGAQGNASNRQTYDWKGIIGAIRETNPSCQIFGTGKAVNGKNGAEDVALASTGGIHWIGNEAGVAADTTWAKVKKGEDYERLIVSTEGGRCIEGLPEGDQWSVPEVDTKMLGGWFWRDSAGDNTAKSESALADIYFRTVGHGATLLLNLSPNKNGTIGNPQFERFVGLGNNIKETFDEDLTKAEGVTAAATSVWKNAKAYSPNNVLDVIPEGEEYDETYWAPAEGETTGSLEVNLGGLKTFDVVSIEEYIKEGQTIASFSVEYKDVAGRWHEFGKGATISAKRLCRGAAVEGTAVRINILSAKATPKINNVGVFKASEGFSTGEAGGEKLPTNLKSIPVTEFTRDSSWTLENNNTSAWSNAAKKGVASFTFTGTKAWIFGTKDTGHGTMDIYIDDVKVGTADTKSDSRAMNKLLYTTPDVEYGEHTVRMVCTKDAIGLSEARYTDGNGIFEMKETEYRLNYGETSEVEIVRTAGSRGEVTVTYATESAGAEQGVNYVNLAGEVTFAEGETSKKVTVTGLDNDRSEDGKDFYFTIMDVDNASIGVNSYTRVVLYYNQEKVKDALEKAVEKAGALISTGEGKYTEESWNAFKAAYEKAKAADGQTSAAEMNRLMRALAEAEKALVERKEEGKPAPGPGTDPGQQTPQPIVLSAPSSVKAVSQVEGVKISFAKVENASSYEIYRQTGNKTQKIATVTGTSYVDKKAPGGKKSTYTVVAVSSKAEYKNSATSTGVSVTLPKAAANLKAKAGKGGVKITFKKVKGAKNYMLYRASKKNGTYKKVKALGAKTTSYLDRKAKKGTNYYKVIVKKGRAYSPASRIVSVKVK